MAKETTPIARPTDDADFKAGATALDTLRAKLTTLDGQRDQLQAKQLEFIESAAKALLDDPESAPSEDGSQVDKLVRLEQQRSIYTSAIATQTKKNESLLEVAKEHVSESFAADYLKLVSRLYKAIGDVVASQQGIRDHMAARTAAGVAESNAAGNVKGLLTAPDSTIALPNFGEAVDTHGRRYLEFQKRVTPPLASELDKLMKKLGIFVEPNKQSREVDSKPPVDMADVKSRIHSSRQSLRV